uniref:Uncharacterized protein n=1 Tax=Arundo donax TaxID=35708 RepID=A0A0A9FQM6_ARUDO
MEKAPFLHQQIAPIPGMLLIYEAFHTKYSFIVKILLLHLIIVIT